MLKPVYILVEFKKLSIRAKWDNFHNSPNMKTFKSILFTISFILSLVGNAIAVGWGLYNHA